jgi:hypothetical protein
MNGYFIWIWFLLSEIVEQILKNEILKQADK